MPEVFKASVLNPDSNDEESALIKYHQFTIIHQRKSNRVTKFTGAFPLSPNPPKESSFGVEMGHDSPESVKDEYASVRVNSHICD